jgi:putative ATP-dependent endonuclease of the OLD family
MQVEKKNPSATSEASPAAGSGIFIKEVRIRNFRCLLSVDVELDKLTVLIGQNNSGKTSFLNAFFAAVGAGQRIISNDDILLRKGEISAPKNRVVVIDILIRPTDDKGKITDVFPSGSPWLELWGNGVVQDDNERDLVVIRTAFKWNVVKGEYVLDRRFLKDWQADSSKWEESKPVEKIPAVSTQQIEPLALYLLDAKRDIADDLRTKSSFWSKLASEHGLTTDLAAENRKHVTTN